MEALHDVVRAGKARSSAPAACLPGNREGAGVAERRRLDTLRLHQNDQNLLCREEERDDPALHESGGRRDPVEPAGSRGSWPDPTRDGEQRTNRSGSDRSSTCSIRRSGTRRRGLGPGGGRSARCARRAGRAGLAAHRPGVTARSWAQRVGSLEDVLAAEELEPARMRYVSSRSPTSRTR